MSKDYEALSAFLDGETSEFETHRVLRDLGAEELGTLARWQLACDIMHGQAVRAVPCSFNARLSEALAAEAKRGKRSGMIGGFARVAVAASVAAATVIGWQYWNEAGREGLAAGPAVAVNAATTAGGAANTVAMESPAANDAEALPAAAGQSLIRPFGQTSLVAQHLFPVQHEPRARTVSSPEPWGSTMLLRHSEFAAQHSGQGMMPYARLISLDAGDGAQ